MSTLDESDIVGDWVQVEDPDPLEITFFDDGTFEVSRATEYLLGALYPHGTSQRSESLYGKWRFYPRGSAAYPTMHICGSAKFSLGESTGCTNFTVAQPESGVLELRGYWGPIGRDEQPTIVFRR